MATESAALPSAQDSSVTIQHAGGWTCGNLRLDSSQEACPDKAKKICGRCHLIKVRLVFRRALWFGQLPHSIALRELYDGSANPV